MREHTYGILNNPAMFPMPGTQLGENPLILIENWSKNDPKSMDSIREANPEMIESYPKPMVCTREPDPKMIKKWPKNDPKSMDSIREPDPKMIEKKWGGRKGHWGGRKGDWGGRKGEWAAGRPVLEVSD